MKNSAALKEWLSNELESREPGYRMPRTEKIAARFNLAPVTVHRILREFVKDGLLERTRGKGTFIPGSGDLGPDAAGPAPARSAADELADTIRASIARGEYKKGDALHWLSVRIYLIEAPGWLLYARLQTQSAVSHFMSPFPKIANSLVS